MSSVDKQIATLTAKYPPDFIRMKYPPAHYTRWRIPVHWQLVYGRMVVSVLIDEYAYTDIRPQAHGLCNHHHDHPAYESEVAVYEPGIVRTKWLRPAYVRFDNAEETIYPFCDGAALEEIVREIYQYSGKVSA